MTENYNLPTLYSSQPQLPPTSSLQGTTPLQLPQGWTSAFTDTNGLLVCPSCQEKSLPITTAIPQKFVDVLEVYAVYLYALENAKQHHTDRYELVRSNPATPVLRRGQLFIMTVTFKNRAFKKFDTLKLLFNHGIKPHVLQGTRGAAVMKGGEAQMGGENRWVVHIKGSQGNNLYLEVNSPVNAPVGAWNLEVQTSNNQSQTGSVNSYKYPNNIFFLFNPWNSTTASADIFSAGNNTSTTTTGMDFGIYGYKWPPSLPLLSREELTNHHLPQKFVDVLEVYAVYLYALENAKQHHTDKYELVRGNPATPVLRRGQLFIMTVTFKNRAFKKFDTLKLLFNHGIKPHVLHGTRGAAVMKGGEAQMGGENRWVVHIKGSQGNNLYLEVNSPVNAPVGAWNLEVQTSNNQSQTGSVNSYKYPNNIFFLFNPWNSNDRAYMPETLLLDEYLLNDVGKIWTSDGALDWVYGQFDAVVLPTAMLVLELTGLMGPALGDPVKLARALSKVVHSTQGEPGVLLGRWQGEYDGGTAPTAWTGSVPILREYYTTKTVVKYGQCWTFAGVVTTVCRTLGLPSRVVTNISSGHDFNENLTIDYYYTADSAEIPQNPGSAEYVWIYHVWSEVWMSRPDLPVGHDGWQVVDATPHQNKKNIHLVGPAPVEAIRKGEPNLRYDVLYLYAAVNADIVRWKQDPNAEERFYRIGIDTNNVGQALVTKRPFVYDYYGFKDREDITHCYKAPEGSVEERQAYYNAVRGLTTVSESSAFPTPRAEYPSSPSAPSALTEVSIYFDLVKVDRINIGESFVIAVTMKNCSEEVRTVQTAFSASSVYYDGVPANLIKKVSQEFKLQPQSCQYLPLTVTPDEYLEKLVEHGIIKIHAIATVIETNQTWVGEDDLHVRIPQMQIIVNPHIYLGKPARVVFQFKNPLKKVLTSCKFSFEGPGLLEAQTVPYSDITTEAEAKLEITFTPVMPGPRRIVATFDSRELKRVGGSISVDVLEQ